VGVIVEEAHEIPFDERVDLIAQEVEPIDVRVRFGLHRTLGFVFFQTSEW
jgi:hypothetical protein